MYKQSDKNEVVVPKDLVWPYCSIANINLTQFHYFRKTRVGKSIHNWYWEKNSFSKSKLNSTISKP